ncbi:MAG: hypothetical protein ACRD4S_16900 [Candidatus Acidiferrales bacterium]
MKPSRTLVNADRLAVLFDLTASRIHQLVKAGMPKELRGAYDVAKCTTWYVRYLRQALQTKSVPMAGGDYASEREERLRNLRADAEKKEMELSRSRGQLVSIDDVEQQQAELVLSVKARILAVAPRIAPEVLGETSRVMLEAKITKALNEALVQLAGKKET